MRHRPAAPLAAVAALFYATILSAQGAVIVNNPAPNPDAPAFRLAAQPVLAAGGANDDPNFDMRYVGRSNVLRDGTLLVSPSGGGRGNNPANVQVFAPGGKFVRAVGRNGEGPGEFRSVDDIWLMPGDSVVVFDRILSRLTIFDPTWKVARTIPQSGVAGGNTLCCFEDGTYFNSRTPPFIIPRDQQGPRDTLRLSVGRAGSTSAMRPVLALEIGAPSVYVINQQEARSRGVTALSIGVPFAPAASYAITARELVFGMPDSYEYRAYNANGSLVRRVRASATPAPITGAMVDAYRESMGKGADPETAALLKKGIERLTLPKTLPAYSRLVAERDGTVWVAGYDPPTVKRQWWARFDPSGKLLGTLIIPTGFSVDRFANGYVVLRQYVEADGATRLFVHKIEPVR